jgi:hypothetical protein
MRARRTARDAASPAAHDLREPVLGKWRYVRSDWPSMNAWLIAFTVSWRVAPRSCAATAVDAIFTSATKKGNGVKFVYFFLQNQKNKRRRKKGKVAVRRLLARGSEELRGNCGGCDYNRATGVKNE